MLYFLMLYRICKAVYTEGLRGPYVVRTFIRIDLIIY